MAPFRKLRTGRSLGVAKHGARGGLTSSSQRQGASDVGVVKVKSSQINPLVVQLRTSRSLWDFRHLWPPRPPPH